LSNTRAPLTCFAAFALALTLAMGTAAALSPAMQALLAPLRQFPLHRVFDRLTMLFVIVATVLLLKNFGLARRDVLGYGVPRRVFFRQLFIGLGIGLTLMLLTVLPLFLLDLREPNHRFPVTLSATLLLGIKAVLTGGAVALIEETFFRGAMQGAMSRGGSVKAALFAVPLLYSAVHFLGGAARIPFEQVTAGSGFVVFVGYLWKFGEPLQIADAFLALYLVGLLLAIVRHRTGNIAACIGLHAGFVAVITVVRRISSPAANPDWSFLVGSFDGLLGLWIAAAAGLACFATWRLLR
jgi:membrane protease YdiL (CAAX protease family)